MKLLTNLLFEPKGRHDSSLAYSIKDTVMSTDGSKVYFALQDVPAGIALTNEDYWILQMDLSASKAAMDEAAANFADYARQVGTKVRGETARATGNPVTFLPDAGSLLQPVTVLEPQQEGSGDPAPGGKNLMPRRAPSSQTTSGVTFTVNADNSVSIKGTATANATFRFVGAEDALVIPSGAFTVSMGMALPDGVATACEYYNDTTWGGNYGPIYVASGKRTFEAVDGTNYGMYMSIAGGKTVDFTVYPQIETGSEATSYSPPANIRPFIGYDKLDLNAAGKNLLLIDEPTYTYVGITKTVNDDGSVTLTGTATADWASSLNKKLYLPNGTYVVTGGTSKNYLNVWGVDSNGESTYLAVDKGSGATFTADSSQYTHYWIQVVIYSGTVCNDTLYPMIRLASVADDTHEPYQGKLHTVQIGQTVYGFRYEWLTGKGLIEWAMVTLDGTENFQSISDIYNGTSRTFLLISQPSVITPSNVMSNVVCSHYPTVIYNDINSTAGIIGVSMYNTGTHIALRVQFTTIEEWKAFLAAQYAEGTPVQISYKLATPIEIQLTPHVISAVDPEQTNTLYGDGTIETTYVKPLHVSIEERVAAIASAMLMKEE